MHSNLNRFKLLLGLCLSWLSAPAFAEPPAAALDDTHGVTIVTDTQVKDKLGAVVRVDLGPVSLKELENLNLVSPDGVDMLARDVEMIESIVFVPSTLPQEDIDAFVEAIRMRIETRFSVKTIHLHPVKIDVKQAVAAAEINNREMQIAAETIPHADEKAEALALADAMAKANNHTLAGIQEWAQGFAQRARAIRKDPEQKSMVLGSLLGMASSTPLGIYFFTATASPWYAVGQTLMTIMTDQLNSTFSNKLAKFETDHQFPFWIENSLVKFYNSKVLLRAAAVNFVIASSTGFTFRFFSWLDDPAHYSSPASIEFASSLIGMNFIGGFATGFSDIGVRSLRKKGYISQRVELLTYSTFNFMNQMNNLLLSSGFTNVLAYTIPIEWGAKGISAVAGWFLPSKGQRLVAIHPDITPQDQKALRYVYDLQEAIEGTNLTADQLRELAKQFELDQKKIERNKKIVEAVGKKYTSMLVYFGEFFDKSCHAFRSFVEAAKSKW